jgi:hypothetical protein
MYCLIVLQFFLQCLVNAESLISSWSVMSKPTLTWSSYFCFIQTNNTDGFCIFLMEVSWSVICRMIGFDVTVKAEFLVCMLNHAAFRHTLVHKWKEFQFFRCNMNMMLNVTWHIMGKANPVCVIRTILPLKIPIHSLQHDWSYILKIPISILCTL